jgi:hypothetical protein
VRPDHKRDRKQLYEREAPDTTTGKNPLTLHVVRLLDKYGAVTGFIVGVLVVISGIVGESLDLEPYRFYRYGRFGRGVETYPYWLNCVLGATIMYLSFDKHWLKRRS